MDVFDLIINQFKQPDRQGRFKLSLPWIQFMSVICFVVPLNNYTNNSNSILFVVHEKPVIKVNFRGLCLIIQHQDLLFAEECFLVNTP